MNKHMLMDDSMLSQKKKKEFLCMKASFSQSTVVTLLHLTTHICYVLVKAGKILIRQQNNSVSTNVSYDTLV